MTSTLELKDEFNDIKNLRDSIIYLLDSLNNKIDTLKNIYQELLEKNKSHSFGLDSLHFQTKVINLECDHKDLLFKIVDNRIYGDYYKLYQNIVNYVIKNIEDKKILHLCENAKNYKVYKDLDLERDYDFNDTTEIHKDIIQIIESLQNELLIRERDLKMEDKKRKSGLNIDNLINSYNYNNNMLKQQIELYIEYIKVFHKFHIKYLHRFNLKAKLFYGQINSDIKLESNSEINIDNVIISKDSKEKNLSFDKDEQEKLIKYAKIESKVLNKFQQSTKKILDNELNCMLTGSSDTSETISEYDESENLLDNNNINTKNVNTINADSINNNSNIVICNPKKNLLKLYKE